MSEELRYPQKSHKVPKMDIRGNVYGKLTVIDYAGDGKWRCRCECGEIRDVKSNNLKNGNTKGCGKCGNKAAAKKRIVAGTQPAMIGSKLNKNNRSGIKGVSFNAARQKWVAQMRFQGKHYWLGSYVDIDDAVAARKEAEDNLHGNFLEWYKNRQEYISVKEFAELHGVSTMPVVCRIKSGELPYIRVGKAFRVPKNAPFEIKEPRQIGKAGYRGVTLEYGKYPKAQIFVNGKLYRLGTCKSAEEAAKLYQEAKEVKESGKDFEKWYRKMREERKRSTD